MYKLSTGSAYEIHNVTGRIVYFIEEIIHGAVFVKMFLLLRQLLPITHHHRGPRPAQSARTEWPLEKARYVRDSTQPLKWMAHGESGLTPEQRDAGKH